MTEAHDLDLRHYSPAETLELDQGYRNNRTRRKDKPVGLWVSVGDAWSQWCRQEEFAVQRLAHCYSVLLSPQANVLVLDTPEQLIDLTRNSAVEEFGHSYPDWASIYTEHDGIIISPYQWSLRLELFWYYGWDVASGCIWNTDAITALTPIKEAEVVT